MPIELTLKENVNKKQYMTDVVAHNAGLFESNELNNVEEM